MGLHAVLFSPIGFLSWSLVMDFEVTYTPVSQAGFAIPF